MVSLTYMETPTLMASKQSVMSPPTAMSPPPPTMFQGKGSPIARPDLNVRMQCNVCRADNPEIIEDYSQGDLICGRCGGILGERIVDMRSEWRSFQSENGDDDPSRVGGPANPLLDGNQLQTVISRTGSGHRDLNRLHQKGTVDERTKLVVDAFKTIQIYCDRIGLPQIISDRAKQLYKRAIDERMVRGRSKEAIMASTIYIACRQEHVPRTLKEIQGLVQVRRGEFVQTFKKILTNLQDNIGIISTEDFLARFCSNLNLPRHIENAAKVVTDRARLIGAVQGKSPVSIAAAGIYLVSQLSSKDRRTTKEIGAIVGVSDVTIRSAYKEMYRTRHEIVPKEFITLIPLDELPKP